MKKWILIGLGAAVVVVGVAIGAYFLFFKSDPEPRAAIKETPVVTEATNPGSQPGGQPTGLDGSYTLPSGATDSFVGYRVTEKLSFNIANTEATGRTSDVTGTLKIAGTTISDVSITANLKTLKSDEDRRDNRIRTSGLESDTFPEAKFVLTSPIQLSAVPAAGETVKADATGDFTLHGVTKKVTIPIEGRWDGEKVQVVGSLPVTFADYEIDAPSIGGFVSVEDHGEMEFQLFFAKG